MEAFEKLEVWKRSARLCVAIYKHGKVSERVLRDQLLRSALSVPSNIAEGYERGSRKEFIRFLNIAKGSCAEMRTQLHIGVESGILDSDAARRFISEGTELSRMLQGLINTLRSHN